MKLTKKPHRWGVLTLLTLLGALMSASVLAEGRVMTIKLKKDKVYEVAYLGMGAEAGPKMQEYFGKVMPLAPTYEAKPLGSFGIADLQSRQPGISGQPHVISLFEWPSVDHYLRLNEDPRFVEAVKIRDLALTYLNNGNFFTVAKDTTITIRDDRAYTITAAWVPGEEGLPPGQPNETVIVELKRFPVAQSTQATMDALSEVPSDGNYDPNVLRVAEWPSVDTAKRAELPSAYRRVERFVTAFNFPSS